MDICNRIRDILAVLLKTDITDISEISMDTIPEWTSLKHIEIIMTIEDSFGVSFSPESIGHMVSAEILCNKVRELLVRNKE